MKKTILTIKDQVNISFSDLDPATRRSICEALKFEVPYARHTPQYKLGRWDGKVSFATVGGSSYFNVLDRILPIVFDDGYEVETNDLRARIKFDFPTIDSQFLADRYWPKGHPAEGQPIVMRDHQVRAVNDYLANQQCLQNIATSAGKTIICAAISRAMEQYGRTLIIVPGKDLVNQTADDYKNIGLDTGLYFGDQKEKDKTHTIATWQSLVALDKNNHEVLSEILDNVVCVIVDECHTIAGQELKAILTGSLANIPVRFGMSGTIQKQDFAFLNLLCSIGPIVGEVRADELQEKGILSNCHIHVKQTVDDVAYKVYSDEMNYLNTSRDRVDWLANFCSNLATTGNTLVLINSVAMGKELSQRLDVPFVYGNVKTKDRKKEYNTINEEDNKLIFASFGVASTGISLPRIFNLVLLDSGKSHQRVIQSVGRGLRVAKDKDYVDIYDICSTAKFSKKHLTERKKLYNDANYPYTIEKIKY